MTTEITQEVTSPADLERLHEITGELVGKACWGAKLGYGDELTLDIGGRVARLPRSVPPKEKGEWVLRARATPWWIEAANDSVAPVTTEETAELLRLIEGATITAAEVSSPDLALEVRFSSGYTLTLTPEPEEDEEEEEDALAYWELYGPRDALLEVGPGPRWSFRRSDDA